MITYKISEDNLEQLNTTYQIVKNHKFRVENIGYPNDYATVFMNLSRIFSEVLFDYMSGVDRKLENYRKAPKNFCMIFHDMNKYISSIRMYKDTIPSSLIIILEGYLTQIHNFINTHEWKQFLQWDDKNKMWIKHEYHEEVNSFELADEHLEQFGCELINHYQSLIEAFKHNSSIDMVYKSQNRLKERMIKLGLSIKNCGD